MPNDGFAFDTVYPVLFVKAFREAMMWQELREVYVGTMRYCDHR